MNVTYPTGNQVISRATLTGCGLDEDVISRIHEVIGEANAVALLSPSPVGWLTSSVDHPAQAAFLADPLQGLPDLTGVFRDAFGHVRPGGFLICRLETAEQRKGRLMRALPTGVAHLRYAGDFMLHRVCPRVFLTRSLYQKLFSGIHALSKAEAFGRLHHAGYAVKQAIESGGYLVIVAQKSGRDYVPQPPSSEGVLLRMWRVGRGGRPFCVFKLRTMHPYSEHLQAYLMETDGLEASGKFRNDFRITTLGRWMRKYWIDELPMLVNVLRGDMKLVGVRPLSAHYFSLYPADVQHERCRHKPGLLPPYYADLPKTFAEIVDSERRYLRAYERSPVKTDLSYLLKISYNIIWKRARSQ